MAASYESPSDIIDIFDQAAAGNDVSQATAAAITALVTGLTAAGAAVAVQEQATSVDNAAAVTAPILMMADNTKVDATFGADSPVKAVILGETDQASNITFQTSDAVTVQLGGASGDSVQTGAGADSITFTGGSASIDAGSGNDVVVLQSNGTANITQGAGNATIILQGFQGAATIDAGEGFDALQVGDSRADHTFTVLSDGTFQMHSDAAITMENVNVVQFMNGDAIDEITVLASSKGEALVAMLYQVALGREAIDGTGAGTNLDGLDFWFNYDNDAANVNPEQLVAAFLACPEFGQKYGNLGDQQLVEQLMNNIKAGTTTINGEDAAYYAQQLGSGAMDIEDVVTQFVNSDEARAALGEAGDGYVIFGYGA